MTARILDGNALSGRLRADISARVSRLKAQGITPALAVVLVGNDPASQIYTRNKIQACQAVGMRSVPQTWPSTTSEAQLLAQLQTFNQDDTIDGILVQLPLPPHISTQKVIQTIAPTKDVDGFHCLNAGALLSGSPGLRPCTPAGCIKMLESINYDLCGKHAVVIGRSHIVGKPMALMLLERNATVTICHRATTDLKALTLQADLIVVAVGQCNTLTADMVKPGAVVIDVGMNRHSSGTLCGDVDFANVQAIASHLSPVPGGVGPMTITMLLSNTLEAAEKRAHARGPSSAMPPTLGPCA